LNADRAPQLKAIVIPLRFKTVTQQRSVVIELGGTLMGFRARGCVGF
jgi:hypothetical protein